MERPSRQDAPAPTPPATHNVRRRIRFIGPVMVMAAGTVAALPMAGRTYGWEPTILTAGVVCIVVGAAWLIAQAASRKTERRLGDSDRDRVRGEAALRQLLADVLAMIDDVRREVRAGRQPKTSPPRRRRRKAAEPTAAFGEVLDGSNVIQLPRPETVALVDRIIRRSINGAVRFPDGVDR